LPVPETEVRPPPEVEVEAGEIGGPPAAETESRCSPRETDPRPPAPEYPGTTPGGDGTEGCVRLVVKLGGGAPEEAAEN